MTKFTVYGQEVNMGDPLPPIPGSEKELKVPEAIDDDIDKQTGIFSKFSGIKRIGARALAPIAAVSSVAFVVAGCENLSTTTTTVEAPGTTTTDTDVTTTEQRPTTTEQGEQLPVTVENLEMDASLMDNPEALIETFINDRVTQWYNAGSTPENAKAALLAPGEWIDFASEVTAQSDPIFVEALLIGNWQNVPSIVEWVGQVEKNHAYDLIYYFATSFPDNHPEDEVPYMRFEEITDIVDSTKNSDGSLSIKVTFHDGDNSDQNRVGEELTDGEALVPDVLVTSVFTFIVENEKVKISNIAFSSISEK